MSFMKKKFLFWIQKFWSFIFCDIHTNTLYHVACGQETLGYIDINLSDVVSNKRINEKYHLIDSKNGRIQIELQWRTA